MGIALKHGYRLKRLDQPVNGYYYGVEDSPNLFAVISKQKNGKVVHDIHIEFDSSFENVEVAIVRPKPNEEEIVDYFFIK